MVIKEKMTNKRKKHVSEDRTKVIKFYITIYHTCIDLRIHINSYYGFQCRCSSTKFLATVRRLPVTKVAAIEAMGFGRLLQLATKEIIYELCQWLVTAYDVPYHRIIMASSTVVDVTLADVEATMGISCRGLDVPAHQRWVAKVHIYSIRYLESQLDSLPVDEKFLKKNSPYSRVQLFWHPIVNQRECMTYGISYGTLMSLSQEIGENSC